MAGVTVFSSGCMANHFIYVQSGENKQFFFGMGNNDETQLLGLSIENPKEPTRLLSEVLDGEDVQQIACGKRHTIVLLKSGEIVCYGVNSEKQADIQEKSLIDDQKVKEVSCGCEFSAAVTEAGNLFVFGSNSLGQLGLGEDVIDTAPVKIAEDVIHVSCGDRHVVYVNSKGEAFSAGANVSGQLGYECEEYSSQFQRVACDGEVVKFTDVCCGSLSTYLLSDSKKVYSCGDNDFGQLGHSDTIMRNKLTPIEYFERKNVSIARICCGEYHTLCESEDGTFFFFGLNCNGQFNITGPYHPMEREPCELNVEIKNLSCTLQNIVLVTEDDDFVCTGGNDFVRRPLPEEKLSIKARNDAISRTKLESTQDVDSTEKLHNKEQELANRERDLAERERKVAEREHSVTAREQVAEEIKNSVFRDDALPTRKNIAISRPSTPRSPTVVPPLDPFETFKVDCIDLCSTAPNEPHYIRFLQLCLGVDHKNETPRELFNKIHSNGWIGPESIKFIYERAKKYKFTKLMEKCEEYSKKYIKSGEEVDEEKKEE